MTLESGMFTQPAPPMTSATPRKAWKRHKVNFAILPLLAISFMIVFWALWKAPWQADYKDAQLYNTASHWDRFQGKDMPEGSEIERTEGYDARRFIDGSIYVGIVFGVLCVGALIILSRAWVFIPLMAVGFYGTIYSATSGVTMGPLIAGVGFSLMMFGALFGWLTSSHDAGNHTEGTDDE
jgi:hypothetical protein